MEYPESGFYHGVFALKPIGSGKVYENIRINAFFGELHVDIVHGNGRKTHQPAIGQFAVERHTTSASCACSQNGGFCAGLHVHDKGVGCTVTMAVGENHDGFLPAYALGGSQRDGLGRGEGIVSFSCLVADISSGGFPVDKTFSQSLGRGELSAGIVAYIYDESAADSKAGKYGA